MLADPPVYQTPSTSKLIPSLGNMHNDISSQIRTLVSKKKKRYQKQGFNLDLTYVTDRIIAMGFPANSFEAIYRNDIAQVSRFFELNHSGNYKIYNLCREKNFDTTKFSGETVRFPFDDHNPPAFAALDECIRDISDWLAADGNHVVAINCKAGKGRTGVIVCCSMLRSRVSHDASAALRHYGRSRTLDGQGVTIPSQIRYVFYYDHLLKHRLEYASKPLWLRLVKVEPAPNIYNAEMEFAVIQANSNSKIHLSSAHKVTKFSRMIMFQENLEYPFYDDIKFEFLYRTKLGGTKNLCQCWLNTFFVIHKPVICFLEHDQNLVEQNVTLRNLKRFRSKSKGDRDVPFLKDVKSQETTYKVVLGKMEVDKAHKDEGSKIFPQNFAITFLFSDWPPCPKRFHSEVHLGNSTFFENSGKDNMISDFEALWELNVPQVHDSFD